MKDASLALARRALEYVGWFDGHFDPKLECDAEIKDLALAVFVAAGEEPPARVRRRRRELANG